MVLLQFKYSSIILALLILLSCNAPHNNPLDPKNPNDNYSTIEGFIKTVKVPQTPIVNANIFWKNKGLITNSNNEGYFQILNIERNAGWLIIEKENYSIDSIYINFQNRQKISQTIFLNAIPKINELNFYSITINKFPSKQNYYLEVRTKISDEENDIDSVFIENSELNTKKELLYNASTKFYGNSIFLEDLNITSIDIVIGKNFNLNVLDADSKIFVIGNSNIKRIIKKEIITTSPSGRDTVSSNNPFLEWRRFTPGFEFKYLLEIYTDEIPKNLVWQKKINSEEIEYQTNTNLKSGDYFWIIWAIDEFENRTSSKPSSFIIK